MRVFRDGESVVAVGKIASVRVRRAVLPIQNTEANAALLQLLREAETTKAQYDPGAGRTIEPPIPLEPDVELDTLCMLESRCTGAKNTQELQAVLLALIRFLKD